MQGVKTCRHGETSHVVYRGENRLDGELRVKSSNSTGYTIKKDATRSGLAHSLISSRLNTRYLQPHCPLSDNIISHGVPLSVIKKLISIYRHYGCFKSYLQTRYYDRERIYTVTQTDNRNINEYRVTYRNDHHVLEYRSSSQCTLEYVGENNFLLDCDLFPVKKNYHHERQLILYVLDDAHFSLEVECLLTGLDTYNNRKSAITSVTNSYTNPENGEDSISPTLHGSYSFRFIVKDGMIRDELNEHIELLQEVVSY
jgi:hypothetical protein